MICMTKGQFDSKLAELQKKNESIEYRRTLRRERWKHFPKIVFPSTSKLILIFGAAVSLEIIIFCQYIIFTTGDTSALYAMIGAVGTFMPIVVSYHSKARAENTVGGITYESAMASMRDRDYTESTDEEAVG